MGVVYEARDPALDRRIALKTIHLSHLSADHRRQIYERRFLAEAQAAGQLSHPGIVVVHDVGRDSETDLLYIALEFLVGRTLAEIVAADALPEWRECLRVLARVARALHHAHTNGVVHRDVKPANIMILPSGEPKIMDFGIAKLDTSELTSPGELFGTPLYMAPEQALGEKVDARSDLFSLGSIAYTMLTGRSPFAASSVPGILARVAHQEPPRPTEIASDLPKSVDYFIARAMAKSPDNRYPDGQKMAEDIEDIIAGKQPRHRRGWTMPERGEGTIYIHRPGNEAPEASLGLQAIGVTPKPLGRRIGGGALRCFRRIGAARLLAAMLAATAVVFYLNPHWAAFCNEWAFERVAALVSESSKGREGGSSTTPAPKLPEEPVVDPERPSDAEGEIEDIELPANAEAAEDEPNVDLIDDSEESAPGDVPTPVPAEPRVRPPTPRPTAQPPARLKIVFKHGLKSGSLRVWIDRKLVLSERLDSRVTRKFLVFTSRKGAVVETLKLKPGRHVITAQVRWDGKVKAAGIRSTLASGRLRCLEVAVHRGKLILRWRY